MTAGRVVMVSSSPGSGPEVSGAGPVPGQTRPGVTGHPIDMLIGAVMALCFAYQFTVLLPQAGIGWQAHIGGLVGGVAAGWIFRERRTGTRPGKGPVRSKPTSAASGPRADLHKQLDDLGL